MADHLRDATKKMDFISREAAISEILSEPTDAHYPSWYADKMKEILTADAVEVVRCKNCAEYDTDAEWCNVWEYYLQPDFFCALGHGEV